MALQEMIQELLGVPEMNQGLARTRINEAFQKIQNENVFSFQCITSGWLTANLLGGPNYQYLSPGTMTVTPFANTITGDPVATVAWTANVPYPPFITQQQIRVPNYSLYSIIAIGTNGSLSFITINTPGEFQTPGTYLVNGVSVDGNGSGAQISVTVNALGTVTATPVITSVGQGYTQPPSFPFTAASVGFGSGGFGSGGFGGSGGTPATFTATLTAQLTIDRPWMEPPQFNSNYMIYQAYYPAPPNFKRWFNIRDTTNNDTMDWWSYTQVNLSEEDPQREIFDQPEYVVPYQIDTRPGSATYGQMLFELWPHPITQLPYTFGCQCNWPLLQGMNDSLPFPLTEELVKERAYEMVSLWKESQKGDDMERGSGTNWQFLVKAHHEEYKDLLRQVRIMDRHLVDLYFTKARMGVPFNAGEPFTNTNGTGNVGYW